MKMRLLCILAAVAGILGSVQAQTIYKCADGKGGTAYQQIPCAKEAQTKSVRSYQPVQDAPHDYGQRQQQQSGDRRVHAPTASSRSQAYTAARSTPPPEESPTGYVRCIKASGGSYLRRGNACPDRHESVQHQAGMVTDVTTGQQQFMVPGGGNGMIDPMTGQRHELISPPPTRRVKDVAVPVSSNAACAQAKAERDRALSAFERTMSSIRAAEARYERLCG